MTKRDLCFYVMTLAKKVNGELISSSSCVTAGPIQSGTLVSLLWLFTVLFCISCIVPQRYDSQCCGFSQRSFAS